MKKLLVALGVAALSTGAMADTWTFTYEGSGYGRIVGSEQVYQHNNPALATGTISGDFIDSNQVGITSGFLSITQGIVQGDFTLAGTYNPTGFSSLPNNNKNRFLYNNILYPNSSPELDVYGLIFENNDYYVNLFSKGWLETKQDYDWNLFTLRKQDQTFTSSDIYGNLTFAKNPTNNAVPEPSEWAAMGLLGTGLLGLVVRGRKKNLAN